MSQPKTHKLPIPLSLTSLVHDTNSTQMWTLQPSFDPLIRSQNRMLRCLRAQIAIDRDVSPVIRLDIKYYEIDPLPNSCVKLSVGGIGVNTRVRAAACGDGTTNVWAAVPGAVIKEGLAVTLQVLSDDIILDELVVGAVQLASAPTAARPPGGPEFALPMSQGSLQTPNLLKATAGDDVSGDALKALEHDDPVLRSEHLPPDYHRLCLRVVGELDEIMDDWKALEKKAGRRLVRFWREQSGSLVNLSFAAQPPLDPYNEKSQMVISCIRLPDREGLWVTSFDIVRLAEYILHLPLNTDMKNRARRNMASVECKTLLRVVAHEHSKLEGFTVVMQFEDPKPRSIEKSIKIYKWDVLQTCLSKILQRFVIHLPNPRTGPVEFEHQLEAVNRWKRSRRSNAAGARPTKTRRDIYVPTFVDQDDTKTKRVTRRSQNPDIQNVGKGSPEYEPAATLDAPLEHYPQSPAQVSPESQANDVSGLSFDKKDPFSNHKVPQSPIVHSTNSPLVVTPPAVGSTSVIPLPTMSIDNISLHSRPIHPSPQRELSSNSLTIVHNGWTVPSHSDHTANIILPSPTETSASSFDSYSPSHSNSASPRFYFPDSNSATQQQYSQNSVSSGSSDGYSPKTSHSGMATSSTVFTPTWSSHLHLGVYVHTPIAYTSSEVNLVHQNPTFGFHHYSQPGTSVGSPYSPALVQGISVNPNVTYSPYTTERGHMLQFQGPSQGPVAIHQVKEEEREIDTDEWLDNDYIMSQENTYIG